MKQLFYRLALTALSASWANGQVAASPSAPVAIYTDLQQPITQELAVALRAEVKTLLSPAGLEFEWWPLADFRSERPSTVVVVTHFEGQCNVNNLSMRGGPSGSLGWVETSDGRVLPFIHVDCARVRTFLQIQLIGFRPADREVLFGRALGRVLAHELYHVLAGTAKHTTRGVAKEDFSVEDLLGARFQLRQEEAGALRIARTVATPGAAHRP